MKKSTRFLSFLTLATGLLLSIPAALSAAPIKVPLTADHWRAKGDVHFSVTKQYPEGLMQLTRGSAELKDFTFENGTIDFDIDLVGHGVLGIKFRQSDENTADVFFIRPSNDCPTSFECIQYMPFAHGFYEWDLFPQYERAAPIHAVGWNHIRLVVSGLRMNVFVNGAASPTLTVGRLEGGALKGAIRLDGPASYANLIVTPNKVDGLSPKPTPDPTAADARYFRNWQVSAPTILPSIQDAALDAPVGKQPAYNAMPNSWSAIDTERNGLVNLTRRFGSKTDSTISVAWLKTTLSSDHAQTKQVSIGWIREVWVYANGKLVFAGKNLYGTPASKNPEGRISLENGTFNLPLRKGNNEIAIALDDNFSGGPQHFGWGLELRLNDLKGLSLKTSVR